MEHFSLFGGWLWLKKTRIYFGLNFTIRTFLGWSSTRFCGGSLSFLRSSFGWRFSNFHKCSTTNGFMIIIPEITGSGSPVHGSFNDPEVWSFKAAHSRTLPPMDFVVINFIDKTVTHLRTGKINDN